MLATPGLPLCAGKWLRGLMSPWIRGQIQGQINMTMHYTHIWSYDHALYPYIWPHESMDPRPDPRGREPAPDLRQHLRRRHTQ